MQLIEHFPIQPIPSSQQPVKCDIIILILQEGKQVQRISLASEISFPSILFLISIPSVSVLRESGTTVPGALVVGG